MAYPALLATTGYGVHLIQDKNLSYVLVTNESEIIQAIKRFVLSPSHAYQGQLDEDSVRVNWDEEYVKFNLWDSNNQKLTGKRWLLFKAVHPTELIFVK